MLDGARRARDLAVLAEGEVVDLLVIGGGITGVGVALDAASRGLSVALVERGDLAAGTSRASSKLVHGGLRYLASGQVSVAAESTRERGTLARVVAPHLIRPVPFVTPLGPAGMGRAMAVAAASAQHGADALRRTARTPTSLFPPPRRIEPAEALRLTPGIRRDGLRGGLLNWDGQLEDDARLVVAVARTAAALGARIITRCSALDVGAGGASVVDLVTGSMLDVRAHDVVNATGVWAQRLDPAVHLRPSRGSHLVLPARALGDPSAAMAVPVPGHFGRLLFAVPQADGLVVLGITDEPVDDVGDRAEPTPEEVDFLLTTFSEGLQRPLGQGDVLGAYAGLRPLLAEQAGAAGATADLSRRHAVVRSSGVITVTGGKLTTYRRMAQDVVDLLTDAPCITHRLPLVGAGPVDRSVAAGLPGRLMRRFGAEAAAVASLAQGDPELLAPIAPGVPALAVEALWGLRAEGALGADDVLDGRLRLDLVPAWRAATAPLVRQLAATQDAVEIAGASR
jgi:glycerol-3-phosphate dehydrogenase